MKSIRFGIYCGIVFGILDILLMIPLEFPDKTVAMTGAFINRFTIGFLIPNTKLHLPYWLQGILLGLLLSLPDAIITKSYVPIISTGIVGGLLIGAFTKKYLMKKLNNA